MPRINHRSLKYNDLFSDLGRGLIKIPQFQRDFVWSKEQTANLIDSIIKGFPIGTFTFWETDEDLGHLRDIGKVTVEAARGRSSSCVLDGQQRITSLFLVRTRHYQDILIDLNRDIQPDDPEPVVTLTRCSNGNSISVYDLLESPVSALYQQHPDLMNKIEHYKTQLTGYDFPIIFISDAPIDVACEIFTRINTGGTELTLFEIMIAKTYDEQQNFNLKEKYEDLIDNNGTSKDLEDAGFETISSRTILQCIAAAICEKVGRKEILQLDKSKFIREWESVKKGIFAAVDYFRDDLNIKGSRLLPYEHLLILFSYFFIKNGNPPDSDQDKWLKQYFWWAVLSRRFGHSTPSRVAEDLGIMNNILESIPPSYQGKEVSLNLTDLKQVEFRVNDGFSRAILCLYAAFRPRRFNAHDRGVNIDNSWLLQSNSKNYHHFFPKDYLKNENVPKWFANNILNITFIDDYLNKRIIRARSPSEYMAEFREQNPEIDDTMKTHLIDDLDTYGIWDNDYETFINRRGERVLKELGNCLGEAGNVR